MQLISGRHAPYRRTIDTGQPVQSKHEFLAGGGDVGALVRAHDWSQSPLGAPQTWPQSLRSVVSFMLNSKFPMFVAWGNELGFLYNDAYAEILGSKHPAALGGRFEDIWSEIWTDLTPLIDQALRGEAVFLEDLPLVMRRRGYDEQTYFTFSYSPVLDESGAVKGMGCVCMETTEKVLAERRNREEYQRLQRLFKQAPGMMAVLRGPTLVFEIANDAYYQFIGRQDVIGKPVRAVFPDLEGQPFFELLDRVYSTGEPYIGKNVRIAFQPDPHAPIQERYFNFICEPIREDAGKVTGIFYEGFDVTEQVNSVAALRQSEAKFRTIADAMPQMVWSTLPDGFHDYYNQQWYDYTGAPEGSTHGDAWNGMFYPEDQERAWKVWRHSLATGDSYEIHYRLRHRTGQYRWVLGRALPIRDDDGKIIRWMGTCTDIHDQKLAEEELKTANRNKDEFLAMLAHELRNPLAPISTAAQVLKYAPTDEKRVKQSSEIISRQVKHMSTLVDDLLDVSRVTRGLANLEKEILDIKGVIGGAVEQAQPLIESRGHTLNLHIAASHVSVLGDRARLIQVISNLLNNAAKYTAQGGNITLALTADADKLKISVVDNGIGIEAALLPHVFELFTQAARTPDRSQGGLGLGLALVKSITVMHGGYVEVFSDGLNKGSTFNVVLPLAKEDPQQHGRDDKPYMERAARPLRMMIVDDNVDAAESLAALLASQGHSVTVEADPNHALRAVNELTPEVFILDIGLPGMNGYELATQLRARPQTANSLYIALTGYGQAHDRVLSKSAGFAHHFVKPMDTQQLANILAELAEA